MQRTEARALCGLRQACGSSTKFQHVARIGRTFFAETTKCRISFVETQQLIADEEIVKMDQFARGQWSSVVEFFSQEFSASATELNHAGVAVHDWGYSQFGLDEKPDVS